LIAPAIGTKTANERSQQWLSIRTKQLRMSRRLAAQTAFHEGAFRGSTE
jgi:hypothetical protein